MINEKVKETCDIIGLTIDEFIELLAPDIIRDQKGGHCPPDKIGRVLCNQDCRDCWQEFLENYKEKK